MARLGRKSRIVLLSLALCMLILAVLWYPYKSGTVPEWKLQVIDSAGRPVVGAQVGEEWNDPVDEGITSVADRRTDSRGFVVFPKHVLHNRLALGAPQFRPAAHISVCARGQFGDALWDEKDQKMATRMELEEGPCPFI
jgi:hypothetical protein